MNMQIVAAKSAQRRQNIMSMMKKTGHNYLRHDGYNIEMRIKKIAQPKTHTYTSATAPITDCNKETNVGNIIDFLFG